MANFRKTRRDDGKTPFKPDRNVRPENVILILIRPQYANVGRWS